MAKLRKTINQHRYYRYCNNERLFIYERLAGGREGGASDLTKTSVENTVDSVTAKNTGEYGDICINNETVIPISQLLAQLSVSQQLFFSVC